MSATKKINMLEGSLWDKMIVFALPLSFDRFAAAAL